MGVFKKIKLLALTLSVSNWVLAPLAQAASSNARREAMNVFLKMAALSGTEKKTVGDFYYHFRNVYPAELQAHLDTWMTVHKDDPMPTASVQEIKNAFGEPQFRISLRFDNGQTYSVTFGDEDVRIGNLKITAADLRKSGEIVQKAWAQEPTLKKVNGGQVSYPFIGVGRTKPNLKEFKRINRKQELAYFMKLRQAVEAADKVQQAFLPQSKSSLWFDPKYEVIARWSMGLPAFAAAAVKQGESCIVAGWVSTYGNTLSCGGDHGKEGQKNRIPVREEIDRVGQFFRGVSKESWTCSGGGYACNPMVYGFNSSGQVHCAERANINRATLQCNEKAPLTNEGKQAIAKSWAKAMGYKDNLEFNEEGKLNEEDYEAMKKVTDELHNFIDKASGHCTGSAEGKVGDKPERTAHYKSLRKDQQQACDDLYNRAFELDKFFLNDKASPPAEECSDPGMVRNAEGRCECRPECRSDGGHCVPNVKPESPVEPPLAQDPPEEEPREKKEVKKKEDNSWCWWLVGGIAVAGLVWLLWPKDKKKKVTNTTPLPPPTGTPTPPPTPTPIEPTQNAEGGSTPAPINSGGVPPR